MRRDRSLIWTALPFRAVAQGGSWPHFYYCCLTLMISSKHTLRDTQPSSSLYGSDNSVSHKKSQWLQAITRQGAARPLSPRHASTLCQGTRGEGGAVWAGKWDMNRHRRRDSKSERRKEGKERGWQRVTAHWTGISQTINSSSQIQAGSSCLNST